jgi:leucyl-tRNA synthetase
MKYSIETEKKWQKLWEERQLYNTDLEDNTRQKYYNLVMFPYPSGDKLHIGHWYNYAPPDSWGRFMRMNGYNVFEPMGYDSFGLPAENYAIKKGVHPTVSIADNIEHMRKQLRQMGPMYDYSKEVVTSNPDYYKWTQWIFLQLYKKGLAYKKRAAVNWCPSCQTVLANEQVQEGQCERCKHEVTKKDLEQWFFRIRDYAEKLLDYEGLDWPEKTKLMQQNWIGRSEGSEIVFELCDESGKRSGENVTVFTTRADTLLGATYMVLAPEHELVLKIATKGRMENVKDYIEKAKKQSDIERSAEGREKTGVFTGAYVIHPINHKTIPVWIADYVLVHYGTGAVMAVPAHDQRDYEFATKYKLPIIAVIAPDEGKFNHDNEKKIEEDVNLILKERAFTGDGILINSAQFTGEKSAQARIDITRDLMKRNAGRLVINYKLRDWLISRQRYWGAPIPIINCKSCGPVTVPEEDLPVLLPKDVDFTPKGDGMSPLNTSSEFVKVKCPKCKRPAKREVDTMDTFVDSSWYFLRYPSAGLTDKPFNKAVTKKWLPVDMYIGGPEHACMHLLYARFINMVLHDMGFVDFKEPFKKLVHQGMITKDSAKMSKSKGNVVSPDEFVEKYGSDVFRMYLMFMGPFTEGGDWNDKGITGISRFTERFYAFILGNQEIKDQIGGQKILNKTIKKVTEDIKKFHFNTAIASLMEFLNTVTKTGLDRSGKEVAVQLIAPLAPHLGEELWEKLGNKFSVFDSTWPKYDASLLEEINIEIAVQINGKVRGSISIPKEATKEDVMVMAKEIENVKKYLEGAELVKEIYIPGKMVSLVIRDK